MEALKPCPFCGGKAEVTSNMYEKHGVYDHITDYVISQAQCTVCKAQVEPKKIEITSENHSDIYPLVLETREKVITEWNTREVV